jgi:hypothetical protein
MYSFDNNKTEYKYESIQHGYAIEYYDDEPLELSLEEMLELEDEEMEMDELEELYA